MRSFVTGVDGFIGSHLAEALVAAGDTVHGLSRSNPPGSGDGVVRHYGDIASAEDVARAIAEAKPERVFHLAAQNNIQASFAAPNLTMLANVQGSLNVFDAVRTSAPASVVVSVGSSAEYGRSAEDSDAITEGLPLLPTSPYGVSKAAQGMLAAVYATVHGLRVLHVRPFAIVGPRKTKDALSDFCRNVVALERGETERFLVGPLGSVRDFVDVRDCVAALVLLSERGSAGGVYNLCNGRGVRLADLVTALQRASARPFEPVADASRLRAADDSRIIGDPQRLVALGYAQRYSLDETIAATLDYWRARTT